MKTHLKRVCVIFLALIFSSGIVFSQSKDTGAIEGIVVDDLKNPLPGAEVKISSSQMIGSTRSKLTDSSGNYRFVGLQPGTYSVEASLQGFTTERREGVRLFSGQSLPVDFILQIGKLEQEVVVKAVAPLIDVKDSGIVSTNIDSKTMTNIIFARGEKPYYTFDVVSLAPGVEGTEAYGTRARVDNVYQIDGVDTSTPSSGSDWMEPDNEIFEEAHVVGLGAPAEYDGFTGVNLSLITKSGGNNFHGLARFFYRNLGWNTNNVDINEPIYSLYEAPPRNEYTDIHFSLGGPILKDRLWFYGAVTNVVITTELKGEIANNVLKQPKYFFKLTFRPSNSIRLWASAEYDGYNGDHRGLSPLRPAEATTYAYSPGHAFNLSGLVTFSERTLAEFKIGTFTVDDEAGGYAGGRPGKGVSGRYDALTGMYSINNIDFSGTTGYRFQANSTLSHHADNFLKGSHDFKVGLEYERIKDRREYSYNGGFFYKDNVYSVYDQELHNYAYAYSYLKEAIGTRASVFVQDAWKITKNITINPGLRFNIYRGRLPSIDSVPFKTSAFVPRIGFAWDIFGDHSTALKVHYGNYVDKLKANQFRDAGTGINDWIMYEVLPDTSKVELYRENSSNPAIIDPNIKMMSVDQFSVGIERALWKDTSLGVSLIYKKWKNFLYRINSSATYEKVYFTFKDQNGIEQSMYAYNKTSPSSADRFYLTNPKAGNYDSITMDPKKEYAALVIEFNKRFSNKWMLNASWAFSKTTLNSLSMDPNAQINSLAGWPIHMIKIFGTFILPYDINLSPYFQYLYALTLLPGDGYRTGGRWTRTIQAPVSKAPSVMIEKMGTNKLPDTISLDLKLEKVFTIKGDVRLGIMADVINVFNRGKATNVIPLITSENFGKAIAFTPGRQYRVGIVFYY